MGSASRLNMSLFSHCATMIDAVDANFSNAHISKHDLGENQVYGDNSTSVKTMRCLPIAGEGSNKKSRID
jgi:hypothetical protein